MNFLEAVLIVLISVLVMVAVGANVEMPYDRIQVAMDVCKQANSTLVSLDWSEATCANDARIKYHNKL